MGENENTHTLIKLPATLLGALLRPLRALHKAPVDGDCLAEDLGTVQRLLGRQRLLVRLVLDQSVALQEARPSVQVQVDVLNVAKLTELLLDVVLLRLLVDVRDEQNPALDSCKWEMDENKFTASLHFFLSTLALSLTILTSLWSRVQLIIVFGANTFVLLNGLPAAVLLAESTSLALSCLIFQQPDDSLCITTTTL